MNHLIEDKHQALNLLCESFKVQRLELFGSAATEQHKDSPSSDLDFLVDFLPLKPSEHFDTYFGPPEALGDLFQRPIDLVMTRAIKNHYSLESVNRTRTVVYTEEDA